MNKPSVNPKTGYIVGATLPPEATTYVTRQADADFYEGLKRGDFCYVLNARQMGKSSLQVRTRGRLQAEGVACALIDIGLIGSTSTGEQWYAGIIRILVNGLGLKDNFDLKTWWQDNSLLSPLQRLSVFIEDILLTRISQPIVIFVDESDGIRRFGQDFFVLIRACYNQRADKPAYQRLTFGILGVASPGDLIADKTITPFNIGRGIELCGFTLAEALPLAKGLAAKSSHLEALLAIVLEWTGGQPFLTQKLCQRMSLCERPLVAGEEAAWVEKIVQTDFLDHWETQDEPMHLRHIRDRILHEGGPTTGRLLEVYRQILQDGAVLADASREQLELRLSGLVVKRQGQLRVYNPIYAQVFNLKWVAQASTLLRPYAQNLRNWQGTQEESWLLRGPALQEAQAWAKEKHLGDEDYKFLAASHQLETRVLQRQKRWQKRAIWGLVLFLGITAGLMVVAGWQWQVAQSKGVQLTQSLGEVQRLRDQGLRTQSLFLADLSRQETEKGNATNGILLALEALPKTLDSPDRPYVNEAKLALYDAVVKNRELKVLTGHTAAIKSAAISPDGQLIATASEDGTARLWEMNTGKLRSVFKGQGKEEEGMNQVAFSPDGQRLLVASNQGLAYLWEVNSGQRLMVLEGHQDSIESASFSPNEERIVTASADNKARLWEARTGKLVAVLQGGRHATFSPDSQYVVTTGSQSSNPEEMSHYFHRVFVDMDGDGVEDLIVGNRDDTANLWDANTGKQIATFTRPDNEVSHTIFSPDGQRVLTASLDNAVRLWDVNDGKQLMVFKGHEGSIYDAVFSADGQQLLTVSSDKTMRLWEVQTGKQLAVISGHEGEVTYAEFSPGGQCVVTASTDNTARLWDVKTGKPLVTFRGHKGSVTRAMFSPTDQRVVTIADDMTVRVWDTNYYCGSSLDKVLNKSMVLLKGHEESVNHAAFSPDNQFVVTASSGGTARLWEVNTGKQLKLFKGYGADFNYVDFSADGQRIIAVSGGGETSPEHTVRLWDVKTTEELASFKHEQRIEQATLSSDEQRLVTFSQDGTVRVWEANTAKLIATLQERSGFRLNGQQVITVSKDDKIYLWEDNTEKQIAVLENPKKRSFLNAFFSPNGERVVRVTDTSEAGKAGLWDMKTGKQLAVLMPQKTDDLEMWSRSFTFRANIKNVGLGEREIEYLNIEYYGVLIAFSPDNQHFFGNRALWDADTGKQQMMLEGQGWIAGYDTFSPDSSLVLTTSESNATLWNVHTGEQVAILNSHEGSILHAAFSPDGQRIVTSSADGTAILWPVFPSTQALFEYARQIVPRQLSCRERVKFFLVEKGECQGEE